MDKIPDDMTLGQYIKMKLDEDFAKVHIEAFGVHPRNCAHCLNRWADE